MGKLLKHLTYMAYWLIYIYIYINVWKKLILYLIDSSWNKWSKNLEVYLIHFAMEALESSTDQP